MSLSIASLRKLSWLFVAWLSACSADPTSNIPTTPTPDGGTQCGDGGSAQSDASASGDVTLQAVRACLVLPTGSSACLDQMFLAYLQKHTTTEALTLLDQLSSQDRLILANCHPVVHAIGRGTFIMQKSIDKSFPACNLTCQSGCYHGVMERFLRGDALACSDNVHISLQEMEQKATIACPTSQAPTLRFQCLHGLGHALMYFTEYDLASSLGVCDKLGDSWSTNSCYGGIFMENVVSATPEKRDLSETDYQYPCNKLDDRYKDSCYIMQTSRMTEMGLSTEQLFEQCRLAQSYQYTCMASIGRDLSNEARLGDPLSAAKKCEIGTGKEREACTRGVVYALADNTWDGKYALPFCASFPDQAGLTYCFGVAATYLKANYGKTTAETLADCERYVPDSAACKAAAEL